MGNTFVPFRVDVSREASTFDGKWKEVYVRSRLLRENTYEGFSNVMGILFCTVLCGVASIVAMGRHNILHVLGIHSLGTNIGMCLSFLFTGLGSLYFVRRFWMLRDQVALTLEYQDLDNMFNDHKHHLERDQPFDLNDPREINQEITRRQDQFVRESHIRVFNADLEYIRVRPCQPKASIVQHLDDSRVICDTERLFSLEYQ